MTRLAGLATLALAASAGPAFADFTGALAPANFSVVNTGTLIGSSPVLGSATFTSSQLTLRGSNANGTGPSGDDPACAGATFGFAGPCQIQATIGLPGTYSFNWSYLTSDGVGPGGDIFGVVVNGNRSVLSNLGGPLSQSGSASFTAASSFGWFINCTDCIGGSATATISSVAFAQAVPEPETYALLLAGLAGIGMTARRRKGRAALRS